MLSRSLLSFLLVSLSINNLVNAGLESPAVGAGQMMAKKHHHHVVARGSSSIPTDGLNDDEAGFKEIGAYFTSKDMKSQFKWTENAIKFSKGTNGADIVVDSSVLYQPMDGLGAAITDSSGHLLQKLKSKDSSKYNDVMDYLFNARTGQQAIRVPMGSSDFSLKQYCFKHKKTDKFSLGDAEEYIIPTLQDALKRNKEMNIILSPWSPPPYLKTSGLLSGGEFIEGGEDDLAEYFLDTVKAFEEKDIPVWAFTMQNEPFLESSWFASMKLSPKQQGEVAGRLRSKLDKAGYHSIKLLAHDHNWANADKGVEAYNSNKAFDGIGFHCYKGEISALKTTHEQVPKAEIHSTECSSTATKHYQSTWTELYWWLNSRFMPAIKMHSRTVILWNMALDSDYGPHMDTVFCENCKPVVTIDGSNAKLEAQSYAIAHYSAAVASTKTVGGGRSHRVSSKKGSNPTQTDTWLGCIDTQAFAAPLEGKNIKKSDSKRIGVLLINKCDDAIDVKVADKETNKMATYNAKPGVHTLVWA